MRQFFFPLLIALTAVSLFVLYTNPTYQSAKALQEEVRSYDAALDKSQELRKTRDQKIAAYNTFSAENKQRLERVLPDHVDSIHLIIDINSIAARHGLTLSNVELGDISDRAVARNPLAVGSSGEAVGSLDINFAVVASYEDFLALMQDIEHSLRVMDVEHISFTAEERGLNSYDISIRTYWLH
ncbi:MAG TPA: type 4a pilus biogenesis protein PilO [Candidatus Paceibacterota bacterium]|nr:type 4a pilus biogenesis protein PilO [Candidatus Paceibacterota bacterium]